MRHYALALFVASALPLSLPVLANYSQSEAQSYQADAAQFSDAQLDQLLAPVALYPDSLLTHILIASTHPLQLVQAKRWIEKNQHLTDSALQDLALKKDWDPSVAALVAFPEVIDNLVDDLDWLDAIGLAMVTQEDDLLSRVQVLRSQAFAAGNLHSNEHVDVQFQDDTIIIQPVTERVVYVPAYNPLHVYGHWRWHDYSPVYWHHRRHSLHSQVIWHSGIRLHTRFFFGGFHWHNRHLVVSYDYYHAPRRYDRHHRIHVRHFNHWKPRHRYVQQRVRNREYQQNRYYRPHAQRQHRTTTPPRYTRVEQKLRVDRGQHGERVHAERHRVRQDAPPRVNQRPSTQTRQKPEMSRPAQSPPKRQQEVVRRENTAKPGVPTYRQQTQPQRPRYQQRDKAQTPRQVYRDSSQRTQDRGKRSKERQ